MDLFRVERPIAPEELNGTVVLYYPPGRSMVNGEMLDNFKIARDIIAELCAGARLTLPTVIVNGHQAWRLEIHGPNGQVKVHYVC